ncbi:MAG: transposase [Spirosoma sp.]|nr:transposase [Spirosoma sp.]
MNVHDCWSSYFSAGQGRHSLCGAHLLRELTAQIERGSRWAKAVHAYLLRAYQATRCGPLALADQQHWRIAYMSSLLCPYFGFYLHHEKEQAERS